MAEREILHQAIRDAADPMALLDRIVRQALVLVPTADGASLEMRRDADLLEYVSATGTLKPYVGLKLPVRQSLSGLSVLTGEVQYSSDALNDPRSNLKAVEQTGLRSMLCVPLSSSHNSVAVLKVASRQVDAFTHEDAERLRVLARFMDATVSAASELAQVTADVLAELDRTVPLLAGSDDEATAARFVANVMTPGLVDQVEALSAIREVLDRESLEIVFQPVVDLVTGKAVSCEALSRISAPVARPPDWWFAAAHRVGLGDELELLAIRKSLAAFGTLPEHLRMSVNVGPHLVLHRDFAAAFADCPMDRLTIELTEHEGVDDYEAVLMALTAMRAAGVRLSLDDTGSGYSGLTHLLQLRPEVIKLDRELVSGIHRDPAKAALATALIVFARNINAIVIAEGIEAEEESALLRELGVNLGQGFLFARPMPAERIREFCA